jgi:hypothetical protein
VLLLAFAEQSEAKVKSSTVANHTLKYKKMVAEPPQNDLSDMIMCYFLGLLPAK